jgi:DNA-binding transcriptional LysR family regulator
VAGLSALRRTHPQIELEILAELRVMSLARHEADLAVRLGRPRDSELVGRRVGSLSFAFYAASDQHQRSKPPVLIGYDADSDFIPEARWLDARFPAARFALRSNSQAVQLEAARAGFGLALLPKYLAAQDPRLRAVSLGALPPPREIWLLTRREARRIPRVRAVADHVSALFEQRWAKAEQGR